MIRQGRRPVAVALAAIALAMVTASCATSVPAGGSTGADTKIQVVAAENVWGSVAAQLGGDRVSVTAILRNPAADPHSYEPAVADARAIASARLVVQNGIGYDSSWVAKLVAANPSARRTVLTVGNVLGLKNGDNPHQWYSAASVDRVVAAITAAYARIDPAHGSYFQDRKAHFLDVSLAGYHRLVDQIRASYAGTPIGASESIVSPLADALGLRILTPPGFLRAISDGNDPTTADKALIDRQIASRAITVYVYNAQNATPDVATQVTAARAAGIPVVTVTETLTPAGQTFQRWQVDQLQRLQAALAAGTRA